MGGEWDVLTHSRSSDPRANANRFHHSYATHSITRQNDDDDRDISKIATFSFLPRPLFLIDFAMVFLLNFFFSFFKKGKQTFHHRLRETLSL